MTEGERAPIELRQFQPRQPGEDDAAWNRRVWQAVEDNLGLIHSIVRRCRWVYRRKVKDDYIQQLCLEAHRLLSHAGFDPSKGSAYSWLVRGLMSATQRECRRKVLGHRTSSTGGKVVWHGWHGQLPKSPLDGSTEDQPWAAAVPDAPERWLAEVPRLAQAAVEAAPLDAREREIAKRLLVGMTPTQIREDMAMTISRQWVSGICRRVMFAVSIAIKTTPAGRRLEELFDRIEEARG